MLTILDLKTSLSACSLVKGRNRLLTNAVNDSGATGRKYNKKPKKYIEKGKHKDI